MATKEMAQTSLGTGVSRTRVTMRRLGALTEVAEVAALPDCCFRTELATASSNSCLCNGCPVPLPRGPSSSVVGVDRPDALAEPLCCCDSRDEPATGALVVVEVAAACSSSHARRASNRSAPRL